MAFLRASFASLSLSRPLPCVLDFAESSASFSLHSGQRFANPGLSGFSSNSSPQIAQVLIGNAIAFYMIGLFAEAIQIGSRFSGRTFSVIKSEGVRAILHASCLFATFLLFSNAGIAKLRSQTLTTVYVGGDNLPHVVDSSGNDITEEKESEQVAVSELKLSPDKRTAGWRIEKDNCCTSYPIPTRLALYRDGKKIVISDGWVIYDWTFVKDGAQVALSTGTVHFFEGRHLLLFDTLTGKRLQEWSGSADDQAPDWAKDLTQ